MPVAAPTRPGRYALELDVVHEHAAWFGAQLRAPAVVMPAPATPAAVLASSAAAAFCWASSSAWCGVAPTSEPSMMTVAPGGSLVIITVPVAAGSQMPLKVGVSTNMPPLIFKRGDQITGLEVEQRLRCLVDRPDIAALIEHDDAVDRTLDRCAKLLVSGMLGIPRSVELLRDVAQRAREIAELVAPVQRQAIELPEHAVADDGPVQPPQRPDEALTEREPENRGGQHEHDRQ